MVTDADGDVETLTYRVPEGQDPAAVMAALRQEGFHPRRAQGPTGEQVVVPCREGRERLRPKVRAVIRTAGLNLEDESYRPDEVRFTDE